MRQYAISFSGTRRAAQYYLALRFTSLNWEQWWLSSHDRHEIYLKFVLKENADGLCEDFRFFHFLLSSPPPLGSFAGSGMRRSQFLSENVNDFRICQVQQVFKDSANRKKYHFCGWFLWFTCVPLMVTSLFLVPGAYTPFLLIWTCKWNMIITTISS